MNNDHNMVDIASLRTEYRSADDYQRPAPQPSTPEQRNNDQDGGHGPGDQLQETDPEVNDDTRDNDAELPLLPSPPLPEARNRPATDSDNKIDHKPKSSLKNRMISCIVLIIVLLLFLICNGALIARLAVGEFKCSKPSLDSLPSNATDVDFDRLFDILLIAVGFLHIPEHIYLLINLSSFIAIYKTWKDDDSSYYGINLHEKMKTFVGSKKAKSTNFTLILAFFFLVALTLPAVCIYRSHILDQEPTDEKCTEQLDLVLINLDHVYHGASFFINIIIVLVRYMMVYFTIMTGVLWKMEKSHNQSNTFENENPLTEVQLLQDLDKVCKKHKACLDDYKTKLEHVIPIYKIFRSFFVFQWIIHLFGLFFHIAHLIRPWIRRGQITDASMLIISHQIYEVLYVIFEGLALLITHVCALKMNAYLRRYIRKVQKDQLQEAQTSLQYSFTHSFFLVKDEDFAKAAFTPRIPGTGLSISLNSPEFMLSIILSVFALIGALVAF